MEAKESQVGEDFQAHIPERPTKTDVCFVPGWEDFRLVSFSL